MTIPGTNSRGQIAGVDEQAEEDEQADLREPAEPFGERAGGRAVRQSGIGEHDCGQIGGEETAGVGAARRGERDHAEPEGRERIQAGRRKGDAAQRD